LTTDHASCTIPAVPLLLESPSARGSLVDLAYESLVEQIFDGQLEPGARLGIDTLAEQLRMSITPVREALNRLVTQGLVSQSANRGFTVAPMLGPTEFHALFAARQVLEVAAARSAVPLHGAVHLRDEVVRHASAMRDADHGKTYRDFAGFTRRDHAFHRAVVAMSGNRFLLEAWSCLNFHLHVSRLYAGEGVIDYADALQEHDAIVDAVRAEDPDRLAAAVDAHIRRAEGRLVRLVPSEQT
jgi:DNA-binding GntR family transcriptional regulator